MMNDDIFDIKNIDDIDEITKKYIKTRHRDCKKSMEVLSLFEIKNILSIDEILVGMYRKYRKIVTRAYIRNKMFFLKEKGLIKKYCKNSWVYYKSF